ncbi:MAG: site-2 protease family protein, partial [Gemmatimonadota bacterium]
MLTWLAPLLVFGLVVFVHELGHFLAAKLVGVYAPVFSIGWGSRVWGRKVGETEYRLSWFPIGGYVAMASREDERMSALEGGGTAPTDTAPDATGPRKGFRPIPLLDGGQILMAIGEGVRGKPFSERARERFAKVGIAMVGLLFVLV